MDKKNKKNQGCSLKDVKSFFVKIFDISQRIVKQLFKLIKNYVEHKYNIIIEQCKFFKRQQTQRKQFEKCYVELKKVDSR